MTTPSLMSPAPEPFAEMFLDGRDAARLLGMNRTSIYALIDRGVITPYKIGVLTVFWRPEVEAVRAARARLAGGPR